jgi:hypothetical protein
LPPIEKLTKFLFNITSLAVPLLNAMPWDGSLVHEKVWRQEPCDPFSVAFQQIDGARFRIRFIDDFLLVEPFTGFNTTTLHGIGGVFATGRQQRLFPAPHTDLTTYFLRDFISAPPAQIAAGLASSRADTASTRAMISAPTEGQGSDARNELEGRGLLRRVPRLNLLWLAASTWRHDGPADEPGLSNGVTREEGHVSAM